MGCGSLPFNQILASHWRENLGAIMCANQLTWLTGTKKHWLFRAGTAALITEQETHIYVQTFMLHASWRANAWLKMIMMGSTGFCNACCWSLFKMDGNSWWLLAEGKKVSVSNRSAELWVSEVDSVTFHSLLGFRYLHLAMHSRGNVPPGNRWQCKDRLKSHMQSV